MNPLNECINNLYQIIIDEIPTDEETLIKMHTRYLEELGDISFPIPIKNWFNFVKDIASSELGTIFGYKMNEQEVDVALRTIVEKFRGFNVQIRNFKVIKTSAHLFLERTLLFKCGIQEVLAPGNFYGKWLIFQNSIKIITSNNETEIEDPDLTTLRLQILQRTIENLLKLTAKEDSTDTLYVNLSQNMKTNALTPLLLCGPVVNEKGVKDTQHTAMDFFNKRISDMRMMAQHRYRVNITPISDWNELFTRLGRASVTLELLSNKPHKSVKTTLNDLSGANKGPSFIFYNCARLSILLKEFDNKVNNNIYPCLPTIGNIKFDLLNQPEEWELLYVYILQFPYVIKNCIRSIDRGIANPQHLITFLSNLSSLFSIYYRRVRILTDPRDHLFARIHSRICLLKALQIVFHNALNILNIEPVQEM